MKHSLGVIFITFGCIFSYAEDGQLDVTMPTPNQASRAAESSIIFKQEYACTKTLDKSWTLYSNLSLINSDSGDYGITNGKKAEFYILDKTGQVMHYDATTLLPDRKSPVPFHNYWATIVNPSSGVRRKIVFQHSNSSNTFSRIGYYNTNPAGMTEKDFPDFAGKEAGNSTGEKALISPLQETIVSIPGQIQGIRNSHARAEELCKSNPCRKNSDGSLEYFLSENRMFSKPLTDAQLKSKIEEIMEDCCPIEGLKGKINGLLERPEIKKLEIKKKCDFASS
ncbi:MAG: hypothetical protein AB7O96_03205 [Pseudobdellovibrionaceae bacterium]